MFPCALYDLDSLNQRDLVLEEHRKQILNFVDTSVSKLPLLICTSHVICKVSPVLNLALLMFNFSSGNFGTSLHLFSTSCYPISSGNLWTIYFLVHLHFSCHPFPVAIVESGEGEREYMHVAIKSSYSRGAHCFCFRKSQFQHPNLV